MSNDSTLITIDVRGEICPSPLIKAMEAMKDAEGNQEIEMITDFLPAVLTVSNAALKQGWNINIRLSGEKEWNVRLIQIV
jgi:TusA-related sulfurtransferase